MVAVDKYGYDPATVRAVTGRAQYGGAVPVVVVVSTVVMVTRWWSVGGRCRWWWYGGGGGGLVVVLVVQIQPVNTASAQQRRVSNTNSGSSAANVGAIRCLTVWSVRWRAMTVRCDGDNGSEHGRR